MTHDPGVQYLATVVEELAKRLDACCPPDEELRRPLTPTTDAKGGGSTPPLAPPAEPKVDS